MIDFEQKFIAYLRSLGTSCVSEDAVPKLYLDWLNTPAQWLCGASPNAYFANMNEAELIAMLGQYILAHIAVPGPLLGSIVQKEEKTYPLLVSMMKNYDGEESQSLKIAIASLIEEMNFPRPYAYYIDVVADTSEADDFTEICVEQLKGAGAAYLEAVLAAFNATDSLYASDCFLDVLADMPFDERVYENILERFLYTETNKAFYASLLGKLGSEKAMPYLQEALSLENIRYYDYMAVKNAFEALGGEIDIERDFSGDKDYDLLMKMGD